MAITEKGICYPSDYNAAADVLADMKQMAESINTKFGDVEENEDEIQQDVLNIKEEQEVQNQDIIKLQEENKEQVQHIEKLESENETLKNQIPTGQASGENITLNDSAGDLEFKKFEVCGNSIQDGTATPESPIETQNVTGSVNIIVCNKNLLPSNFKEYNVTDGLYGYYKLPFADKLLRLSIKDKNTSIDMEGVYFGFTTNGSNANNGKKWMMENGTLNSTTGNINNLVNGNVPYFSFYPKNEETLNKIFQRYYVQVELEEVSDYVPHKSQQITFPLAEGQRMYKDSYLADDGIHHKRKQVVFDGTETDWSIRSDISNENFIVFRQNKYVTGSGLVTNSDGFCSHFKVVKVSNTTTNNVRFLNTSQYGICFTVSVNIASTVDEWNAYLADQHANGTPVTVECELEDEVIEPYTEEQQAVYNEIKKAISYKNITHIFSTDETSPVFEVTYRKDLETMFNNINNAILGGN